MQKRITTFLLIVGMLFAFVPSAQAKTTQAQSAETDILLVCAHPGDEYLFLPGILPIYGGEQGRRIVVVYLSAENEQQKREALTSIAKLGDSITVKFADFPYMYADTLETAQVYWNAKQLEKYLVELYRTYRPAVVVTHDENGEFGHGAHRMAAAGVLRAATLAAKPNAKNTQWQVRRVYLHRYAENAVTLSRDTALKAYGGKTALEVEQILYADYGAANRTALHVGDAHPDTQAVYGLAYRAKGTAKNVSDSDLLAGLDENDLTRPAGQSVTRVMEKLAAAKTIVPVEVDEDSYFRQPGDPTEVVVFDTENEHWEYRTDELSILIDRIHTTTSTGKPVCYCVADIRMRNKDAFRPGLRDNGMSFQDPREMAREQKAVLAITGDNLTRAETELKGILMRNGTVYSGNQAQDTLAMLPEERSVKIFRRNTVTPKELLAMGVENTFSFGPTLVYDGECDDDAFRSSLGKQNPRCGLGMVEPGHLIAITVDGRQARHSVGISVVEFSHLFYSYGCTSAYNLDGGSSMAMIFMGEYLSQHSGEGSDIQRMWADALFWGQSDLVPAVDDPVQLDG